VRGVIVEDDLDRSRSGIAGLRHIEEFDEFATAAALTDDDIDRLIDEACTEARSRIE